MKKELLSGFTKTALEKAREKSPAICIGIAIAAAGAAIGATIVATRKAEKVLEEHRNDIQEIEERLPEEPTEKQVQESKKAKAEVMVKTGLKLAKTYIFVIVLFLLCAISAITSHRINIRRQMALEAAFAVTSAAMKNKSNEVEALQALLPNKKVDEAKTEKIKKRAEEALPATPDGIHHTGYGTQLCMDYFTGDWFYADHEWVREKIGELDDQLRDEHDISVETIHNKLRIPVWPIHKGVTIKLCESVRHFKPEFRYFKLGDIPGTESDVWAKNIPPLTPVLAIDYEDAVIESNHVHGKGYNYWGDF